MHVCMCVYCEFLEAKRVGVGVLCVRLTLEGCAVHSHRGNITMARRANKKCTVWCTCVDCENSTEVVVPASSAAGTAKASLGVEQGGPAAPGVVSGVEHGAVGEVVVEDEEEEEEEDEEEEMAF